MDGQPISARALGEGEFRRFASEHAGPRPGGTPAGAVAERGPRTSRPTKP